jgi:hypothetical protein
VAAYRSRCARPEGLAPAGHPLERGPVENRRWLLLGPGGGAAQDLDQVVGGWERNEGLEHEPVELSLGERIGALLFDRVLGGHDQERTGQGVALPAERHHPLLHGLEQCRLGLGGGPVDLVGEHQIGEDRALVEDEVVTLEDLGAEDVGGHQVGGELDASELHRERRSEGGQQLGLAQAGNSFEKDVPFAQRSDEDGVDQVALTDDHGADLLAYRSDGGGELVRSRICIHGFLKVGEG